MAEEMVQEENEIEEIETDQYVVFSIKSQEFGFQAMRVQEITSVLETTDVPNSPNYIEGIMNLRGRLATVINFRKRFGFEPKEHDEDTRIIIVEEAGYPIGVLVDSVEEVIKIRDEDVQQIPESTSRAVSEEYITGVGMTDERLIVLLDVDKVLTQTELVELGRISEIMEKSLSLSEKADTKKTETSDPSAKKEQPSERRKP